MQPESAMTMDDGYPHIIENMMLHIHTNTHHGEREGHKAQPACLHVTFDGSLFISNMYQLEDVQAALDSSLLKPPHYTIQREPLFLTL